MTVYLCEFLGRRFGSCGLAYSVQSKLNAEGIERSVELKTRIGFNLIFCLDYLAMAQDVFGVERRLMNRVRGDETESPPDVCIYM